MSNCINKVKNTCGSNKVYAVCTYYEGSVPEWSTLVDEDCRVVEETTQELYNEVTTLKEQTDLSDITSPCVNFVLTDDADLGFPTVKTFTTDVITALDTLLCPEANSDEATEVDITGWNLDFGCLTDPCDVPITKLSQLMQILINAHCACCTP